MKSKERGLMQSMYGTLFKLSKDAIVLSTKEGGIIDCNQAMLDIFGFTSVEITKLSIYEFYASVVDSKNYKKEMEEKGSIIDREFDLCKKDGSIVNCLVTVVAIPIDDGTVLHQGVYRDITERKRAEQKIVHLNAVLRAVRGIANLITRAKEKSNLIQRSCEILVETRGYENAWIMLLDDEGKFELAASAGGIKDMALRIEMAKRGQLTGCVLAALERDHVVISRGLDDFNCKGCPFLESRNYPPALSSRIKYNNNSYGVLTVWPSDEIIINREEYSLLKEVATDLAFALYSIKTEALQRQAERNLRKSEANLVEAQLVSRMGSWEMDIPTGKSQWSEEFFRILGLDLKKVIPSHELFLSCVHPDDRKHVNTSLKKAIYHNKAYEIEYRIVRDGSVRNVHAKGQIYYDNSGNASRIMGTSQDITERKMAAKIISKAVIMAQEDERKRIARELHDETAQALVSLGMDIDALSRRTRQITPEIYDALTQLGIRISDVLVGVRQLSRGLRPPLLGQLGFLPAIEELIKEFEQKFNIKIRLKTSETLIKLSDEAELMLFRIVQEALNNIVAHARASKVLIEIDIKSNYFVLNIKDNGLGFDVPENLADFVASGKVGLLGMQERVSLLGGRFEICSYPNTRKGTRITIEVPSLIADSKEND